MKIALMNAKNEVRTISVCIWFNVYSTYFSTVGCGELWAIDGNWKLHYPVCMFDVDKSEDAFSNNLNYVKTCSNGPLPGNAFCSEHSEVMKKKGVPVTLKEYLNFKKHVQCFSGNVGVSVQSAAICQGMSL